MATNGKKVNSKKIYTCKTCGKVTTKKGHLCTPVTQEKTVYCDFCGSVETDTRHVCAPKVLKLKYYCENCGRVEVSKNNVCEPKVIPKAKPKAAVKPKTKTIGKKTTTKKKK